MAIQTQANRLQQNLINARADLRCAQDAISIGRALGGEIEVERDNFYRALDRVWDLQCMAGASL
jgi:hypothetical protein